MLTLDLLPWWVKGLAVAAVLGASAYGGWYVEGLRWTAHDAKTALADQREAIDLLKTNLAITSEALQVDSVQALSDAKSLDDIERIRNEILKNASASTCLSPDATDGLRKLFDK